MCGSRISQRLLTALLLIAPISACDIGPNTTGPQRDSLREPLFWADGSAATDEHFGMSRAAGCDGETPEAWLMSLMVPVDGEPGVDAFEITFVGDPSGAWWTRSIGPWLADPDLIPNGYDSGLRTLAGTEIWLGPGELPDYVYLVQGGTAIEAWPRLAVLCA